MISQYIATVLTLTTLAVPVEATVPKEGKITGSLLIQDHTLTQALASAKITSSEAINIAANLFPGTVLSVAVENEDGYLVYAIEILSSSDGKHEILVDAGNGKVLSKQKN